MRWLAIWVAVILCLVAAAYGLLLLVVFGSVWGSFLLLVGVFGAIVLLALADVFSQRD